MSHSTQVVLLQQITGATNRLKEHYNRKSFSHKRDSSEPMLNISQVPPGISYLSLVKKVIQISKCNSETGLVCILEPIVKDTTCVLLIICSNGNSVWINGQLAPRVAIAREKDEILFASADLPVFVSLQSPNKVVKTPKDKIGYICPICRRQFEKDSQVYICYCGMVVHSEAESNEDHNNLVCASLLKKCLDCGRPIELYSDNEFSFIPSDLV